MLKYLNASKLIFLSISYVLRWLALYLSFKSAYRLHHSRLSDKVDEIEAKENTGLGKHCLSRRDLILWINRPTSFPNVHNSAVLQVTSITFSWCHSTIYTHIVAVITERVSIDI